MVDTGSQQVYRRVAVSVRPTRAAVAIEPGEDWKRDVLHLLETLPRFWGGAGDAIFLADSEGPLPVWRALEAFDADVFGYYVQTMAAWRQDEPDDFAGWVNKTAQR